LSVALAIKGFGLYAMIAYSTFGPFLTMALLYTTSAKVPKLCIQKKYISGIFSFGGWLTLSVICNKIATYIDRLVLPKMTSVETLGAYTRPASFTNNLTGALTDVIDKVLFPMLSEIQDDRQAAINVFYRATELLNSFSVILGCVLFFNAELIIQVFFGEEWLDLVPVLRVVSLTSVFFIDTQLVDCFFRSMNFVKTGFFIRLFALLWNLFCLYWGAKYGVLGIAISMAFANISVIILKMLVLNKKLGSSKRMMFAKWFSSWKVAITPVLFGLGYLFLFHETTIFTNVVFAFIFGLVIVVEFLFVPSLVGKDYSNTIYPLLLRKLHLRNK
jgi:PST family polysaccharide transporter